MPSDTLVLTEWHDGIYEAGPGRYYRFRDTIEAGALKSLLNRPACYRQQFDDSLAESDRREIAQDYNRFLKEHIPNGVDGRAEPVWKTGWYVLK